MSLYDFAAARAKYLRFPQSYARVAASDYETTGTNLKYSDRPFMGAVTFNNGECWLWQAEVDPLTRQPLWTPSQKKEIADFYADPSILHVMSNKKFDIRCAAHLAGEFGFDPEEFITRCHDTIGMHHALKNNESHALKDAAAKHGGISDDDESDLKKATTEARKIAATWGWKIASKTSCPLVHKRPNKGWEVMDYWVPRQVALKNWRDSESCKAMVSDIEIYYEDGTYEENSMTSLLGSSPESQAYIKSLPGWEWHPPEVAPGAHPWHTVAATYCKLDTLRSVHLFKVFKAQLEKEALWHQYTEHLISSHMTFLMEEQGLEFNADRAKADLALYEADVADAKDTVGFALSPIYPVNPRSGDQVRSILYGKSPGGFGLPVTRRTVNKKNRDAPGKPTIDKDFLADVIGAAAPNDPTLLRPPRWHRQGEPYSEYHKRMVRWHHEIIGPEWGGDRARINQLYAFCASLMMYKKSSITCNQIKSFLRRMAHYDADTGFATLYHSLNSWGTKTTRLSGSEPNPQNISKGGKSKKSVAHLFSVKQTLRSLFGPSPGREWWSVDYTQLQLVILAFMSKDDKLISAVLRGEDFHDYMARIIFGLPTDPSDPDYQSLCPTEDQRGIAKNVNFAFAFGAQEKKIEQTAGMHGLYSILENRLPALISFLQEKEWEVRKRGYVYTMGGYKLYVPEETPYAGSVYAVQGTEGEIGKRATYGVQDYIDRRVKNRNDFYITLPLHDELDFSAAGGYGQRVIGSVCQIMEDAARSFGVTAKVVPKICTQDWSKGKVWEFDEEI